MLEGGIVPLNIFGLSWQGCSPVKGCALEPDDHTHLKLAD